MEQRKDKEGFKIPIYCPRGRDDCVAISQIISTDHSSFICCGQSKVLRRIPQDIYTFCKKSSQGVDVQIFEDARDIAHTAAVLAMASAVIAPVVQVEETEVF
jgi:hypothetical protein